MADSSSFSGDINQVFSSIISTHSIKENFLRELIFKASDDLDTIRYLSLTDSSVLDSEKELEIRIIPDKANKSLILEDSGIGMTRADLTKSGTKGFLETLYVGADVTLISQFGVGLYSAYMVADKVTVFSKDNDDVQYKWESDSGGSFVVTKDESSPITRGTRIVLQLKEDCLEYLEEKKVKELVKNHCESICFPIKLQVEKETEREVNEDEDDAKVDAKEGDEIRIMDMDEEEKAKGKKTKKAKQVTKFWSCLNEQKPIWKRKPEDVHNTENAAFGKASTDWEDHLAAKRVSVESKLLKTVTFNGKKLVILYDSLVAVNQRVSALVMAVDRLGLSGSRPRTGSASSILTAALDGNEMAATMRPTTPAAASAVQLQQLQAAASSQPTPQESLLKHQQPIARSPLSASSVQLVNTLTQFEQTLTLLHQQILQLQQYYAGRSPPTPPQQQLQQYYAGRSPPTPPQQQLQQYYAGPPAPPQQQPCC